LVSLAHVSYALLLHKDLADLPSRMPSGRRDESESISSCVKARARGTSLPQRTRRKSERQCREPGLSTPGPSLRKTRPTVYPLRIGRLYVSGKRCHQEGSIESSDAMLDRPRVLHSILESGDLENLVVSEAYVDEVEVHRLNESGIATELGEAVRGLRLIRLRLPGSLLGG